MKAIFAISLAGESCDHLHPLRPSPKREILYQAINMPMESHCA